MVKNWKRATIWGIFLWVLIFAEVSILMFLPGLAGQALLRQILHLAILPFLVILCSYMYFKPIKKKTLEDGFVLGVYFLVVGTILDLLITIPFFVKTFAFYTEIYLWLGFLEVLLFSSLTGHFLD